MNFFKSMFYIVPIMIYFFMEALLIGIFINFAWKSVLYPPTNIYITYFQWVIIIWTIKVLLFDVFKFVSQLNDFSENNYKENNKENE